MYSINLEFRCLVMVHFGSLLRQMVTNFLDKIEIDQLNMDIETESLC